MFEYTSDYVRSQVVVTEWSGFLLPSANQMLVGIGWSPDHLVARSSRHAMPVWADFMVVLRRFIFSRKFVFLMRGHVAG